MKEPDGIIILEAPISALYTQGVLKEARRHHPGRAINAVLSTSDSWPHTGGVRQAVALGLPVYILDLNRPLLDRMMSAPHTMEPDALREIAERQGAALENRREQAGTRQRRKSDGTLSLARRIDRTAIHGLFSGAQAAVRERHAGIER